MLTLWTTNWYNCWDVDPGPTTPPVVTTWSFPKRECSCKGPSPTNFFTEHQSVFKRQWMKTQKLIKKRLCTKTHPPPKLECLAIVRTNWRTSWNPFSLELVLGIDQKQNHILLSVLNPNQTEQTLLCSLFWMFWLWGSGKRLGCCFGIVRGVSHSPRPLLARTNPGSPARDWLSWSRDVVDARAASFPW